MGCYCKERETNPGLAETMKSIPVGYCGICDICGKPGHMRGHPHLPTTKAWCDEHWSVLIAQPGITLDRLLIVFILIIFTVTIGIAINWWVN